MIRNEMLLALIFVSATCGAIEKQKSVSPTPDPVAMPEASAPPSTESVDLGNELVIHHHDLATHLGLKSQDVIFTTPRNFRSRTLNEMGLDDSQAGDAIDPIEPLTDNR